MALVPGLLLILAALHQESTATFPENSTGVHFIVAFPENIAYYHPDAPENKVQITALRYSTSVTVQAHIFHRKTKQLQAGETWVYDLDARMELSKSQMSNNTLQITSTKPVAVHAINLKKDSMQTALVVSANNLGTEYHIPPVPRIKGTTEPASSVTTDVTERGPFKLVIINSDKVNTVTLEGAVSNEVSLEPYQLAQFWVKESEAMRSVKAASPVAVLFGHPCAIVVNCTCGMLFTPLPPANEEKLKFFVPPILAKDAESETFLLLSDKASLVPFNADSSMVKASGTVLLYRPGMLLSLIPEEDFASCYILNHIPNINNYAVLVVHKDQTDGVRLGSNPLSSPKWQEMKGTDYVSTNIVLTAGKNIIWHTSSKMAVYFVGKKKLAVFGNPAPSISKTPDFRGCVLTPEVLEIGEVASGWPESVKYCREKNLQLISLNKDKLQKQVSARLSQTTDDKLKQVWIGLRRSSLTGEWYWVSKDPVTDTNWEQGEPGTVQDGQCAMMSLDTKKDFSWSDEDCCKTAIPVCYSGPVLLPVE
ncbi:IgGFc-binding protein [Centroberyx affinis]|uniref:IgGFc-binding protein n=1 Tax=Centroberyx affinis TaxID=166261 RepID=UPI003A5C2424